MRKSPITNNTTCGGGGVEMQCVRIVTGSRLHFGLIDTSEPFGGVGVMIDEPLTVVSVRPSESFDCTGPESDRVASIASRIAESAGKSELPACKVEILNRPPAHSGLGSGTQLSLALADALVRFLHQPVEPVEPDRIAIELACRGKRSAVGSHGYFHGGLIYEEASDSNSLNPIHARVEMPESWRVAVLRPTGASDLVCGRVEAEQFGKLPAVSSVKREALRTLITDAMIPAACDGRFREFVDAVHRYNRASGELFAEVQGGPYHGPHVTELVQWMIDQGAAGVGQSSWGPGVFAWFESEADWNVFKSNLPSEVDCIAATKVRNQGRTVQSGSVANSGPI